MRSKFQFSIVTVSYCQEEYLTRFLSSISSLEAAEWSIKDIIIVDNYGGCEQWAESAPEYQIKIIPSSNIGYLKGLGLGVQCALEGDIDLIIICNPDIQFMTPIESDVVQAARDMWVVAPQITDLDGKHQNPNRRKPFSRLELVVWEVMARSYFTYSVLLRIKAMLNNLAASWSIFMRHSHNLKDGAIFLPHGSCMLLHTELLKKTNFFDEDLFLWGEEAVIAGLARRFGSGVKFVSSLQVKHFSHSSTAKIAPKAKYKIWQKSWLTYRKYLYQR